MADDNLLDDIRAAATELAGEQPEAHETPETPTEPPKQPTEGRDRDEAGRFKPASEMKPRPKEQRETLSLKPKEAPVDPNAAPKDSPIPAPADFKGAGKIDWNRLPRAIQAELAERASQIESARTELAPVRELIDSHKQLLINEAGSVQQGMTTLFALARMSVDNPVGLIQHIAQTKGIDLRALVGGQPQQGFQAPNGSQPPPDLNSLIGNLVQQHLQPFQAQIDQRENQQIESEVSSFRADAKHPYFEDVRYQMGVLLKAGSAKTMDEAYDMACWANPTIRAQLQNQAAEEADKQRQAKLAQAQRASAANLRGSPLPNALNGKGDPNASVRDDVIAAARELSGA